MSYRKQADPRQAWTQWLREHQPQLERIGLPLAVYQDAAHWDDFLQNGHLHWHGDGPPFEFSELSSGQMRQLVALLESAGGETALLGFLRVRLDQSPGGAKSTGIGSGTGST